MDCLKKNFLYIAVFITGAAVLIIEISATRILAPYFGNTLFSISSIVGVILGALSLGYYAGGILADKRPSFSVFFFLVFAAGLFTPFIVGIAQPVLAILGFFLSIKTGPPIASLILFFAPIFILGMMSPFAIKLKSLEAGNIGRISGAVFFWSTLGSIAGSFAAGFLLIPHFGIRAIIFYTGLALMVLGLAGMRFFKDDKPQAKLDGKLLIFPAALLVVFLYADSALSPKSVIFQKDGLYSKITVEDRESGPETIRVLRMDRDTEGGIFLESDEMLAEYTKYYSLYKTINPDIKNVLFLGGGPYVVPRKLLLEENTVERIDIAEIEPELYLLARKYFGLQEDRRLVNNIADGRRFLKEADRSYDMIFADVFQSSYSIPVHFTTQEFFILAKSKLSGEGFILMNVIGKLREGDNGFLLSEMKTFRSVFGNSYFFAVRDPNYEDFQNFIFLGLKDDARKTDFSGDAFAQSDEAVLRDLQQKLLSPAGLSLDRAALLTDDFAPVEYLMAQSF